MLMAAGAPCAVQTRGRLLTLDRLIFGAYLSAEVSGVILGVDMMVAD